ncbi:MAG TPA: YlbF family regulator [Lachnospiraceae bacterium]|nr:YlbF family regulator [Lachnospiraceae bacterium]
MSSIEKSTQELITSIKNGAAYKQFRKCEKALEKYPGLTEKLDRLRGDIYRMYYESENEDLLDSTEELQKIYQEMHKIPEVNAYLDAETELCMQIRSVYRCLVDEIGIRLPVL